jgi:nucleotide-binding universal stress UspA family protein
MDWRSLQQTLAAACEDPDEEAAEQAVRAAELVAATAGEPPDDLSPADREWVETHGIPSDELLELACRSMKCVAALSDDWHDRLNDLRFRLGDVAAA